MQGVNTYPAQVLIADDEEDTRLGLCYLIQRSYPEIEILQAKNGLEAWEMIRKADQLAIAFIDIRMPGQDGLQLCERIRAEGFKTKITIISGYREFDYAREALRYGVSDYLLKPVHPGDIIQMIRQALLTHQQQLSTPDEDERQARLIIEQVCKWIHDHLDQDITLADLARKLNYSPNYLGSLFKIQMGKGFQDYLTTCRLQRATHLLKDASLSITDVAEAVGYTSAKAFSNAFRKGYGTSPVDYREKHGIISSRLLDSH